MGRIKKVAGTKHEASLVYYILSKAFQVANASAPQSTSLSEFISVAKDTPLAKLPSLLESFPQKWPFPRGDLYHWIPLLDRFDAILEQFISEYKLDEGPQTQPFGLQLLQKGLAVADTDEPKWASSLEELQELKYGPEGDRELVEVILAFSR